MSYPELFDVYNAGGPQAVRDYLDSLCDDCAGTALVQLLASALACRDCRVDFAIEALRHHAASVLSDDLPT